MRISFLLLLTVIQLLVFGQKNLDVVWGSWGVEAPNFESYASLGQSFEDSTGYLIVNEQGILGYYDETLHKRYEAPLFNGLKDFEIILTRRYAKKAFIVVLEKKTKVKLYKYNYRDKTAEFVNDLFEIEKSELLRPIISPDSSKYLFCSFSDGKEPMTSFFVCDSLLRLKWDRRDIPVQNNDINFLSPAVNNQGDVAFADTDKESLLVRVVYNKGKELKSNAFLLVGEKYVNTVSGVLNSNFVYALLYNKDKTNIICSDKIQIATVDFMGNSIKNSTIELENCLANEIAMHLVPSQGSQIRIILERFATNKKDSNNQCNYGAFQVLGIDTDLGSVLWSSEIFKNLYFVSEPNISAHPSSEAYETTFGHGFFVDRDNIYLLYGDNCHNCVNTVANPQSHSNIRNSCLAMASIDTTGFVARHTYAARPTTKYKIDAKSFVLVSPGKVLVKVNSSQKRFGVVTLNRHIKPKE